MITAYVIVMCVVSALMAVTWSSAGLLNILVKMLFMGLTIWSIIIIIIRFTPIDISVV